MFKIITRWIFFIPAGLLCGALVGLATIYGSGYSAPGSVGSYVINVWGGGMSGAAAMYVFCFVAPSHREKIALIVSLLVLALYGITIPFILEDSLDELLMFTSQAVGYIIVGWQIFKKKITFKDYY